MVQRDNRRAVFCQGCGTRLPAAAHFCEECGATVPASALSRTPAPLATALPDQRAGFASPLAAGQSIQFNPTINVTVTPPAPAPAPMVYAVSQGELPLLLRVVWFLVVGLWFGLLWVMVAWLLNVTILGLPLGLAMINRVPQVMTLKRGAWRALAVGVPGGATVVTRVATPQLPLALRALYFVFIGVWLSLVWSLLAWLAAVLLVPLPLSFWMFEQVPIVTTLRLP